MQASPNYLILPPFATMILSVVGRNPANQFVAFPIFNDWFRLVQSKWRQSFCLTAGGEDLSGKSSAMDWTASPTPKFTWSPNPQWDYIGRYGLQLVIRFIGGHEGGVPLMGLVPLQEQTPRSLLPLSLHPQAARKSHVRTKRRQQSAPKERALTRYWLCWHLDLGLAVSRMVRNKFPWLCYLVLAAEADQDIQYVGVKPETGGAFYIPWRKPAWGSLLKKGRPLEIKKCKQCPDDITPNATWILGFFHLLIKAS